MVVYEMSAVVLAVWTCLLQQADQIMVVYEMSAVVLAVWTCLLQQADHGLETKTISCLSDFIFVCVLFSFSPPRCSGSCRWFAVVVMKLCFPGAHLLYT